MKIIKMTFASLAVVALTVLIAQSASGQDPKYKQQCCPGGGDCGSKPKVCKSCKPHSATKKVEVVCWSCRCEDFCVPKQSKRSSDCGCAKCFQPTCATVRTRKKLMMKVIVNTVPATRWDVVESTGGCGCGGVKDVKDAPPAPPAPNPEANLTPAEPTPVAKVRSIAPLATLLRPRLDTAVVSYDDVGSVQEAPQLLR